MVRHKVARQIRHSVKEHLSKLSPGTLLVVRALPGSPMADIAKELSHLVPKTVAKTLVPQ